jgi:hypothetical protein
LLKEPHIAEQVIPLLFDLHQVQKDQIWEDPRKRKSLLGTYWLLPSCHLVEEVRTWEDLINLEVLLEKADFLRAALSWKLELEE